MLDLVSTFKDSKKSHITIPKEIVNELKKIFSANKKYLGISPGSNTPKRIWSFENYMNVAKYFEDKGFNIVYFLGPQEKHMKKEIIKQIKNPIFPEETLKNYLGLEVVMGTTKFLDIAIANDSGTGQMLSTNLCPCLLYTSPSPRD